MTSQLRRGGRALRIMAVASVVVAPAAAAPPATIQLTGVVRDFREKSEPGGHPDFENMPPAGLGRYSGAVALSIAEDGKPVYAGGVKKVAQQWRDSAARQIAWCMHDQFPAVGDVIGQWGQASTGGITSAASFDQWFRDTLLYNLSMPLTITLEYKQATGMYVFDDQFDPLYASLGGFFPIDSQLYGNSAVNGNGNNPNLNHNFHFTFEVHTQFQYQAALPQSFKFEGNNSDVWVFCDGHLLNDLIGIHAAHDQFVDLQRLGLVDQEWYSLDFFYAQRFRPDSHFRIETNVQLESVEISTVSIVCD